MNLLTPSAISRRRGGTRVLPKFAVSILATALLLILSSAADAYGQGTNFNGNWSLYYKGEKVEVGRWVQVDKFGKEFGGREIRGPYLIHQDQRGNLWIYHGKVTWLVAIPVGEIFDTRRTAEGYDLGPYWGDTDALQLRLRPGGTEIEIWNDKDGRGHGVEYFFTDYTLVREGGVKQAPSMPDGGSF
jgi:hypothetical protein